MSKKHWELHQKNQKIKQKQAHTFNAKICHWDYCTKCGLVALKNKPTAIAMAAPCPDAE